jgi:glutathione S-transferase
MLTVHHLNNSRSQRILWLLEELGTPYEIAKYQRMEGIPLAPPELKQVHPLGKSPVITDKGKTIAESGAIVEYIIDTYGGGRLKPSPGTDDYWRYVEWMHYAEGSAMFPLLLALMAGFLGDGAALLKPRIDSEIANNLSYIEQGLRGASSSSARISPARTSSCCSCWKRPARASSPTPSPWPIATGCMRAPPTSAPSIAVGRIS